MTFLRTVQSGLALVLAVASLATTGCSASWRDTREERDPLLRRARERRTAQDIPGSIELYQRALDKKPGLARAHLELGAIYDQNQRDYVRAIYHYQRYLELQPAAEKKELVQELIRHAHLSFAASLPDRPNEAVREIAMLKQEISALHQELERVRAGAHRPRFLLRIAARRCSGRARSRGGRGCRPGPRDYARARRRDHGNVQGGGGRHAFAHRGEGVWRFQALAGDL
jgi:tetratricopeptide (TPR) repeat protein